MPRVKFDENFSHVSHPSMSTRYKAGGTYVLSQAAADEAVAKGKGKIVPSPGERRPAASAALANDKPDDEGR